MAPEELESNTSCCLIISKELKSQLPVIVQAKYILMRFNEKCASKKTINSVHKTE